MNGLDLIKQKIEDERKRKQLEYNLNLKKLLEDFIKDSIEKNRIDICFVHDPDKSRGAISKYINDRRSP